MRQFKNIISITLLFLLVFNTAGTYLFNDFASYAYKTPSYRDIQEGPTKPKANFNIIYDGNTYKIPSSERSDWAQPMSNSALDTTFTATVGDTIEIVNTSSMGSGNGWEEFDFQYQNWDGWNTGSRSGSWTGETITLDSVGTWVFYLNAIDNDTAGPGYKNASQNGTQESWGDKQGYYWYFVKMKIEVKAESEPEPGPEVHADLDIDLSPSTITWNYKEFDDNDDKEVDVELDASGSTSNLPIDDYEFETNVGYRTADTKTQSSGRYDESIKVYPDDINPLSGKIVISGQVTVTDEIGTTDSAGNTDSINVEIVNERPDAYFTNSNNNYATLPVNFNNLSDDPEDDMAYISWSIKNNRGDLIFYSDTDLNSYDTTQDYTEEYFSEVDFDEDGGNLTCPFDPVSLSLLSSFPWTNRGRNNLLMI